MPKRREGQRSARLPRAALFLLPWARPATTVGAVRDRLIEALLHGDRAAWAAIGVLWALTTILVLSHRPPGGGRRASTAFTFALLAMSTATSLAGIALSAALAVPRIRWKAADAPELLVTSGGPTWRRLRGPAVAIPGPDPDIAVPTLDGADRWVLVGLLSGKPVPGLPAAEAAATAPGAARLCRTEGSECRAWPVAWPDPAKPASLGELTWTRAAPPASRRPLAVDVETGLYLTRIDPAPGVAGGLEGPHLEMVGRAGVEPKLEGPSVVFAVRSVVAGRLRAARIAATPDPARPGGLAFHLHRADASLTAAPRMFLWVAGPLATLTGLALPLGLAVYLFARRRRALDRALPWLETSAALAAGVAAAAPALVAVASLWGSR